MPSPNSPAALTLERTDDEQERRLPPIEQQERDEGEQDEYSQNDHGTSAA